MTMTEAVEEPQVDQPKPSKEAKAAITAGKKEGKAPLFMTVAGREFVFRAVTRSEWRSLVASRNQKLLEAGEDQAKVVEVQEDEVEELVKLCLLYPAFDLDSLGAGVVQHVADAILYDAGFGGPDIQAVRL